MALANDLGLTNKVVSERHHYASQSKLKASEAAKQLSKLVGVKVSAKEIVSGYKTIHGREPEWHHSGFYKKANMNTMGRTFFFTDDEVTMLAERWVEIPIKTEQKEKESQVKRETIVKGFYFIWDSQRGARGRKVNFKRLQTYEGPELNTPSNFTRLSDVAFETAKTKEGKEYFGWDEPRINEFEI